MQAYDLSSSKLGLGLKNTSNAFININALQYKFFNTNLQHLEAIWSKFNHLFQ